MLRLLRPLYRRWPHRRRFFSGEANTSPATLKPPSDPFPNRLPPSPLLRPDPAVTLPRRRRRSSLLLYTFAGVIISAAATAGGVLYFSPADPGGAGFNSRQFYKELEETLDKSGDSMRRVFDGAKRTGAAGAVLWKSLRSVMSSANQEVRSGFELRVAALLADIVAASAARRAAIVAAGGGAVVDWLLETVATARDGTQAEAARALASLVADPAVCGAVLGRPRAVPNLLRFIFSFQPHNAKKQVKSSSFGGADAYKGRSMLVAAIMDIVTSDIDNADRAFFQPILPGQASMEDISAALQVIEAGTMHFEDTGEHDDGDDGSGGLRAIGMKVLGGATVLGFSEKNDLQNVCCFMGNGPSDELFKRSYPGFPMSENLALTAAPGLWDDLQREHVAVPFAAWSLANWAMASDYNRCHIQELDRDGKAITTALMAPERTVKWHGSLIARLLLEDAKLPLTESVPQWSSSLLSTISHACNAEDVSLARIAFSAFLASIERSPESQDFLRKKGLDTMRQISKQTSRYKLVQEAIAKALEIIFTGDNHLSMEESKKWSSILLSWICGKNSTEATRSSAASLLSCALEDYGPVFIPISQGWLTILLMEVLTLNKSRSKGTIPIKTDKVKTQIDESNAVLAAQITDQLARVVVQQAAMMTRPVGEVGSVSDLSDFLSMEPFSDQLKNMKKDIPKIVAADSAMSTLKGIKALTEVCADDLQFQNKIVDFGVLCLLRRFLLRDDYEKLAASEAYDASRVQEDREQTKHDSSEATTSNVNDRASVRVPPTAHIRKHAARLLAVLSLLPKVRSALLKDESWLKWLDDCAMGRISGCSDFKIRSYARMILLNTLCNDGEKDERNGTSRSSEVMNGKQQCPSYGDMIFLINPELAHWKCPDKSDSKNQSASELVLSKEESEETLVSSNSTEPNLGLGEPAFDIVFVHGLRGGPFRTWRISDDKSSTTSKSGLVEKIDQEAGMDGTFWPGEWLSSDFPNARLFTVKYKTNLTQWSGASLPLQEVSSTMLKKLAAAGIGSRPVVFVTHSMGGLVVKQMLYQAKAESYEDLFNNTVGIVFYSCPHFGSKLADMPWRMGLVFRPAPSIGELRSGSQRLVELNDFVRHLQSKGYLDVLSFSETMVTPIVEGYGGWAFRLEVVPIESAYPGFGDIVVLEATDHINSCKPVSRSDPAYTEIVAFLQKLKAICT